MLRGKEGAWIFMLAVSLATEGAVLMLSSLQLLFVAENKDADRVCKGKVQT